MVFSDFKTFFYDYEWSGIFSQAYLSIPWSLVKLRIFYEPIGQEIPGVTGKFGLGVQNEAGKKRFPREYTGHSKHPLPTTQEKTLHMDITT